MQDIAPQLLKKIQQELNRKIRNSPRLKELKWKVEEGTASYRDAHLYSTEIGKLLAEAFNAITAEELPDGKMYFNIANRVLPPPIKTAYYEAMNYAGEVQGKLNKAAGLSIKNVPHTINEDRVSGIVDIVSGKDDFNKIKYMLNAPVQNLVQSAIEMTIQTNAEFHYKTGLTPTITRLTDGNCCAWCDKVAGVYKYPLDNRDVYRRHKHCTCVVLYDPKDGKGIRGVHSKQRYSDLDAAKRKELVANRKRDSLTAEQRKEATREKQRKYRESQGAYYRARQRAYYHSRKYPKEQRKEAYEHILAEQVKKRDKKRSKKIVDKLTINPTMNGRRASVVRTKENELRIKTQESKAIRLRAYQSDRDFIKNRKKHIPNIPFIEEHDIINPTEMVSGHSGTPKKSKPNAMIDHVDKSGKVDARGFYNKDGLKYKDIHTTNHGNPKTHQYGKHGEHAHDYVWNLDGSLKEKTSRELNEKERSENGKII